MRRPLTTQTPKHCAGLACDQLHPVCVGAFSSFGVPLPSHHLTAQTHRAGAACDQLLPVRVSLFSTIGIPSPHTTRLPKHTAQVLHATSCIPFVSVPCTYIAGLGRGLFYDGG